MVPRSLRFWFVVHFVVDFIFAVPLLLAPVWLMTLFGFESPDPFTGRLVGAALLGIGGESLLGWEGTIHAQLEDYLVAGSHFWDHADPGRQRRAVNGLCDSVDLRCLQRFVDVLPVFAALI